MFCCGVAAALVFPMNIAFYAGAEFMVIVNHGYGSVQIRSKFQFVGNSFLGSHSETNDAVAGLNFVVCHNADIGDLCFDFHAMRRSTVILRKGSAHPANSIGACSGSADLQQGTLESSRMPHDFNRKEGINGTTMNGRFFEEKDLGGAGFSL